jgi:hypothetical protein
MESAHDISARLAPDPRYLRVPWPIRSTPRDSRAPQIRRSRGFSCVCYPMNPGSRLGGKQVRRAPAEILPLDPKNGARPNSKGFSDKSPARILGPPCFQLI